MNLNTIMIDERLYKSKSMIWLLEAFLYASYNLILVIPVLTSLGKLLTNEKSIKKISIAIRDNHFYNFYFNIFIIDKYRCRHFKNRNASCLQHKK
jgi:hypothetical protein